MANYKHKMPPWNRAVSEAHIVFFVLFDTPANELARVQCEIQKAILLSVFEGVNQFFDNEQSEMEARSRVCEKVPPITVELISWQRYRISTRRDLVTFWNE